MTTSQLLTVDEVRLVYQTKTKPSLRPKIDCARDINGIMHELLSPDQIALREFFYLFLLNRANKLIGVLKVSEGGIAGTIADPKLIFAAALKAVASSIIISHNHPSGNNKPSQSDIILTNKISKAAKFLDMPLLDHVIVTPESDRFFSFADEGMIN